jgi:hypothetical protein
MVRHGYVLGACTLFGMVVILLSGNSNAASPEDIAAAQKKVLEIADDVAAKKDDDVKKKVTAYVKTLDDYKDLEAPMKIMALRDNGGLGFGPKGSIPGPDGIEARLINLGRRPLSEKDLAAQSAALSKSADIISAISEMALVKGPTKKVGNKDPKDWMRWSQDMKDGATALSAAVAKKDPTAIKEAAEKLNVTCTDCHNVFKKK